MDDQCRLTSGTNDMIRRGEGETDTSFRRMHRNLRIIFWMMTASLVLELLLFIGVFFLDVKM